MPKETLTPDGIPISGEPIENKPLETALPSEASTPQTETKVEEPPVQERPTKETESTTDDKTLDFTKFLDKKSDAELPSTPPVTTPQVKSTTAPTRDLSDLDPDIAPVFKQMSNEAFAKLKPIILEQKKLKEAMQAKEAEVAKLKEGRIPDSYYEHPEGYRLDPEFAEAAAAEDISAKIVKHWRDQLLAIRNGSSDYEHLYIDKDGKYAIDKRPADASAEADILLYYNNAQHSHIRAKGAMEQFAKEFSNKHTGAKNWVNQFESQAFSLFDKEEGKHLNALVEDTIKNFPPALRNSIAARVLAKSLVTNQQFSRIVQQLTAPNPEKAKQEDKAKAGPNASEAMSGSGNGRSDITIDDFEKYKAGIL
jgi:hypothetical protein